MMRSTCVLLRGKMLGSTEGGEEWRLMPRPLVIDSGGAETVLPTDWFTGHELRETEESRGGQFYVCAGGRKIPNYGKRTVNVVNFGLVLCSKHDVPGDRRQKVGQPGNGQTIGGGIRAGDGPFFLCALLTHAGCECVSHVLQGLIWTNVPQSYQLMALEHVTRFQGVPCWRG